MLDMEPRVALYQEMIDRYSDSHPFLLVKLADLFVLLFVIPFILIQASLPM